MTPMDVAMLVWLGGWALAVMGGAAIIGAGKADERELSTAAVVGAVWPLVLAAGAVMLLLAGLPYLAGRGITKVLASRDARDQLPTPADPAYIRRLEHELGMDGTGSGAPRAQGGAVLPWRTINEVRALDNLPPVEDDEVGQ